MKVYGFDDGTWIDEQAAYEEGTDVSTAVAEAEISLEEASGNFDATFATDALERAGWRPVKFLHESLSTAAVCAHPDDVHLYGGAYLQGGLEWSPGEVCEWVRWKLQLPAHINLQTCRLGPDDPKPPGADAADWTVS